MVQASTAKLRNKAQYQTGLAQPVVARSPHFVLHGGQGALMAPDPTLAGLRQIAAVTPKRWAKRAVTRNTIRRQIYQKWLEWFFRLPPGTYVVRLNRGWDSSQFHSASSRSLRLELRVELDRLFAQLL